MIHGNGINLRPNASWKWQWPAATIAAVGLCYGPLLWQFSVQQWTRPQYQYFPFVIGAFIWLLWRNVSIAQPRSAAHGRLQSFGPVALMSAAWMLLGLAYYCHSPWLAVASAILLVASRFLRMAGDWHVPYLWGIWAMLWLIVPVPLHRDQQLINWLQHVSSRFSSIVLDSVGVAHLMDGNTLLLPANQFFVDQACSGIVSVMCVIACTVIYGIWLNRPPAYVVILVLTGIGWATFMNVLRITLIALLFDKWGVDWGSGTAHEVLSLVIFTLIFLGLVSTDMIMLGFFAPIRPTWNKLFRAPAQFGRRGVQLWDIVVAVREQAPRATIGPSAPVAANLLLADRMTLRSWTLTAFALLGGLQFMPLALGNSVAANAPDENQPYLQRALACTSDTLSPEIGTLQRARFIAQTRSRDDELGNYSRTYEYRDQNDMLYLASCDFPYPGEWHELTVCYRGQGWALDGRRVTTQASELNGKAWPCIEANFSKPDGSKGFLVACAFDSAGQAMELPSNSLVDDFLNTLTHRQTTHNVWDVFQVQVWTTSAGSISERERDAARNLLSVARERFRNVIAASGNSNRNLPSNGQ